MTTEEANARCDTTGHVFDKGAYACRCGRSRTDWPRGGFVDERWSTLLKTMTKEPSRDR